MKPEDKEDEEDERDDEDKVETAIQKEKAATAAHLAEMMDAVGKRNDIRAKLRDANKMTGGQAQGGSNAKSNKGKGKGKGNKGKGKTTKGKGKVAPTAKAPSATIKPKAKAKAKATAGAQASAPTAKAKTKAKATGVADKAEQERRKEQQAKNARTEPKLLAYLKKHPDKVPSMTEIKGLLPGGCAKCRWGNTGCSVSCWTYKYCK